MSSYTSQPYGYDAQPQPQQRYPPQPQPHAQNPETALMPHPQHRSSYNTPQHLTPYNPYANQAATPQPSRRPSQQSHPSHHSTRSHHSHHSHRSEREEREMEKRPSLGDTMVLMWDSIMGAFSRRR